MLKPRQVFRALTKPELRIYYLLIQRNCQISTTINAYTSRRKPPRGSMSVNLIRTKIQEVLLGRNRSKISEIPEEETINGSSTAIGNVSRSQPPNGKQRASQGQLSRGRVRQGQYLQPISHSNVTSASQQYHPGQLSSNIATEPGRPPHRKPIM
jgi:hypothetical protein